MDEGMIWTREAYLGDLRRALPGDFPNGARILVTGASGMIGSFLVDALMLGNRERSWDARVVAMSRSARRLGERFRQHLASPLFEALARDVTEPIAGAAFDYIVHAASPAHPLAYAQDPVGVMKANLLGAIQLLELLKAQGHGRMLYVSSGEIYGENRGDEQAFREDSLGYIDCASPRACYPESKRAAEALCASYARQHGVDAVIARPCHVYGPTITDESSRADAQFLRNALAGQDIVMKSEGKQIRSYLYVADAAKALLMLMTRGEASGAYNLANPDSVLSIREYAQLLADAAGVALRMELPSEQERAGYSKVTRAVLDPGKLMALGYRASYPADVGIKRMVEICRG